ncbi:T9SS type A sorting domain-containing protein [Flavisolibacter ginsenosidimutans]|uniref:Secretion system C-terminal sorting domain-containing protein n=1 Tax=Flavisolibacter ginsenosidimutans TaxID=661481 RepID=A0A5B8UKH3_9BACT|nr:T9SS type A sorting domain-containing protein [Flavisolibacter ginsenosidimutans]QEC56679.1 hypothetical protein FSB75_12490 [Flavisolibacter ginsenosidimutans]
MKDCEVNLAWKVEKQLNLKSYEVEVSQGNTSFTKLSEVAAKSEPGYLFTFALTNAIKASLLYVRIKSIDLDGSNRYTKTIMVTGLCASKMQLAVFPNPISDAASLTVAAKEGMFNGTYKVSILSSNGQLVQQREIKLSAAKTFPLAITRLSAGKYHIDIVSPDGTVPAVLNFEKL